MNTKYLNTKKMDYVEKTKKKSGPIIIVDFSSPGNLLYSRTTMKQIVLEIKIQ